MKFIRATILALGLLSSHHHAIVHHKIHYNYAVTPCAPGHPAINPDWGACRGDVFMAS